MSLNALDLLAAIQARLATSLSTDARGVYVNRAPPRTRPAAGLKPYVIIMVSGEASDTFTSNGILRQITVFIVDAAENGLGPTGTAWTKIYGNSDPINNTAPTNGIHRWRPTFASGNNNTTSLINFLGDDPLYDEDPNAFGLVMRFQIQIDYGAPTPPVIP